MSVLETPTPRLRGRLHQAAFFVSVPAGITLVAVAAGTLARAAGAVYAVSLSAMFAASAAFHRIQWRPAVGKWMRRLDHSMIFLPIAGTYTPFSLLVLDGAWSVVILAVVWTGALGGIALKLSTSKLSGLGSALYIILGWMALVAFPLLVSGIGLGGTVLLLGRSPLHARRPRAEAQPPRSEAGRLRVPRGVARHGGGRLRLPLRARALSRGLICPRD